LLAFQQRKYDPKLYVHIEVSVQAILAAAQRNLDRWKESALGSVSSLVEMERDFVTAAFFRHAVAQRSAHMQQLEQMHDIMDSAPPSLPFAAAAAAGHTFRSSVHLSQPVAPDLGTLGSCRLQLPHTLRCRRDCQLHPLLRGPF